jgi:hypothetical protein
MQEGWTKHLRVRLRTGPSAGTHCRTRIRLLKDAYADRIGMDLGAGSKRGTRVVCEFTNPTGLVMCFGLRFGVWL